jgi:1,4-alpha-glucan branching enzyme
MKTKPKETVKKAIVSSAKKEKAKRVTFSVRAKEDSKVFLAGSFNEWDPTAKEMTDKKGEGVFTATLNLPAGRHEYKFVIDGIWCADPENTDWLQNELGTLNSVKTVE